VRKRYVSALLAFALVGTRASTANACGAAYPGGPIICTMNDAPGRRAALASPPPIARVFASYSFTSTTILFGDPRRADLVRSAAFVGAEMPVGDRGMTLRFGAGGVIDGHLALGNGGRARLGPGPTGFFGFGLPIIANRGAIPFVQLSATLAATRVATLGPGRNEGPSFTAFDLRTAATAGYQFDWFVPYVAGRVFGGPIFYRYAGEAVTGTDLNKYQVAGGFAASLFRRSLDLFVEGVPLGERGVSAGFGTTF